MTVTTDAGFGLDTTGQGINLSRTGAGAVSFTDANNSSITGSSFGLLAVTSADPGNMRISSNASNTGLNNVGLYAINQGSGSLTVTTKDTTRRTEGIHTKHSGAGDLTINSTGLATATGTGLAGILARNYGAGANSSVTAASVSGSNYGISAHNFAGRGSLSVTTTGTITGSIRGINVRRYGTGPTSLTVSGAVRRASSTPTITVGRPLSHSMPGPGSVRHSALPFKHSGA